MIEFDLEEIGKTLLRLDKRRHTIPATTELSFSPASEMWVAQLIAEPLPAPVCGLGGSPAGAIQDLGRAISQINWRRVKR